MEFGIVSLGNHALSRMIPAIIDSGNRISAVYSSDRLKGEKVSTDLGAEYFDSIEKFMKYDMDAVYISSPNYMHYKHAKMALNAGKNVLLEKPMTLKEEESKELVELSEREHLRLSIGFHLRFHPGIQKAKEIINSGELGDIVSMYGKWTHLSLHALPSNSWWGIPDQAGGGSIVGTGVHVLDSFTNLVSSKIKYIYAKNFPECKVIEDTFSIMLQFENDVIGNSLSSRKISSQDNDLIVIGKKGTLRLTNAYDTVVSSVLYKDGVEISKYNGKNNMYVQEVQDFVGPGKYIADGNSGLVSTRILLLSQKSACNHTEIKF